MNTVILNLKIILDNYIYFFDWLADLNINQFEIIYFLWNIILLIVPYYICLLMIKYQRVTKLAAYYQKIIALLGGFIWILFIPNAAYVMFDVRHLVTPCQLETYHQICPETAWYVLFFFAYAVIGWIAIVYLLRQMGNFLSSVFNKKYLIIYDYIMPPILSLGIMLGLLQRWNSWDIIIHPKAVISYIGLYIADPMYFLNWSIVTALLYFLCWLGEYLFKKRFNV